MILLIDNYDSFTYNVKQEIEVLGFTCQVVRNDQINIDDIRKLRPDKIVISPGPGRPEAAGITPELLKAFAGQVPVFGICLGHQAMGYFAGGNIVRGKTPMHGKVSKITHQGLGVFEGLPPELSVARYHSLVIERATAPASLEITALSEDGEIMGVRNQKLLQEGVQFHPESIATECGRKMIENFLKRKSA